MEWYYTQAGVPAGPMSERDFQGLAAAGALNADSMVWHPGLATWQRYGQMFRRGAFFAVPAADSALPPEPVWHYFCAECGRPFTADNLISFGEARICSWCKPTFYQRVREGAALPGVINYGGFWPRFGAKFIDSLIVGVINFTIQMMMSMTLGISSAAGSKAGGPSPWFFVLMMLTYGFALGFHAAYNTWFVGRFEATPGKMAFGLKVVRPDGGRLTYGRAFGRHFAEMLSGLTLYIGYLIAAFDDERRTLHDRLADTRVVRTK
jgi:uncharacterized RDD family membrane protein YckC